MEGAVLEHVGPWTEDDYFALGETPGRVELIDGSLLVTPNPCTRHQRLAGLVGRALFPAAADAGLSYLPAINVRLGVDRVVIPDFVVTATDGDGLFAEASEVILVGEILAPGNAGNERVSKLHFYAAAGIGWYLLVGQQPLTLELLRLEGDRYVDRVAVADGGVLKVEAPFSFRIDTASLAGRPARAGGPGSRRASGRAVAEAAG